MNDTNITIRIKYDTAIDWIKFCDCFIQNNAEVYEQFCKEQTDLNSDFIAWMGAFNPRYYGMIHKTVGSLNTITVAQADIINKFVFESNEKAVQFKLIYGEFIKND